uniref:J domain-containing protein n=1 Tax=Opuntia streptacantha TaxID=393608 RepID=A0A7C9DBU0_OPUST
MGIQTMVTMANTSSFCPNLYFPHHHHNSLPLKFSLSSYTPLSSSLSSSSLSLRFLKIVPRSRRIICAAASAAGNSDADINPYEVLGVKPVVGFDMIKAAYTKKRKDAELRGDEATVALLDRAYDEIMMAQLTKRKKGETSGSFKVSENIKFADMLPVVPWGPRYSKSDVKDMRINIAISAVFIAWIFIQREADWKPIQFLAFAFVYRIFEKLKASEPSASSSFSEFEEDSRALRMGKRLVRSLVLVFGCITAASLAFTGVLNLIEFAGGYIPAVIFNNQELIVTSTSAIGLCFLASYYR